MPVDARAQMDTTTAHATAEVSAPPRVGVVIATHNRPQLMRKALDSVLAQEYEGGIEVILVFDRSEPEQSLARNQSDRAVRVTQNSRTPGLAGARNTGILALTDCPLIAFCDDDDTWLPGKLTAQVKRLGSCPEAAFVTTAMLVECEGRTTERLAKQEQVTLTDMVRSRMAMLHSSSFLFRRESMLDGFGLVDEDIPRSMAEDWDLLLRAARQSPVEHVDEPLVKILWGTTSYFNDAWRDKNEAHVWLLAHHPELVDDSRGAALQYAKLAFGHASLGERRTSLRYLRKCLRRNALEPRAYLALAVVLGCSPAWMQRTLNQRGHGI